jgi:hypothetical protein
MTSSEVEQRLERLLSSTREATLPDAGARARTRAALEEKLASAGPGVTPRSSPRWLGFGALALGLGAAGLFFFSRGPRDVASTPPGPALLRASTAPPAPSSPPLSTPVGDVDAPLGSARVAPARSPAEPSPAPRTPGSSRAAADGADAADELSLVRAMQQALRANDGPRALALASEHERRFPRGTLVEEREGTRAIARCRGADAATRVSIEEQYRRRFGASPYAARVQAACR